MRGTGDYFVSPVNEISRFLQGKELLSAPSLTRRGYVQIGNAAALPYDDVSDDSFTDEEPTDEGFAIDDKTVENLFAHFDESLLDDLLAV